MTTMITVKNTSINIWKNGLIHIHSFSKSYCSSAKGNEEESKQIIDNLIENYQESPYSDELITCESKEKLCELKLIYTFEKESDEVALIMQINAWRISRQHFSPANKSQIIM